MDRPHVLQPKRSRVRQVRPGIRHRSQSRIRQVATAGLGVARAGRVHCERRRWSLVQRHGSVADGLWAQRRGRGLGALSRPVDARVATGAGGGAIGFAAGRRLTIWTEGDAHIRDDGGGTSIALVNETAFEAFRGVWFKVSPQGGREPIFPPQRSGGISVPVCYRALTSTSTSISISTRSSGASRRSRLCSRNCICISNPRSFRVPAWRTRAPFFTTPTLSAHAHGVSTRRCRYPESTNQSRLCVRPHMRVPTDLDRGVHAPFVRHLPAGRAPICRPP